MAAHYIGPQLPLGEFVARIVNDYQGQEHTDGSGRYLKRSVRNKVYIGALPDLVDTEPLEYATLHALCENLAISPEDFGVPLDMSYVFEND